MTTAIAFLAATVVILVMVRFVLFRMTSNRRYIGNRSATSGKASRDSGWEPSFTPLETDEAHVSMF
ncbi:hypothetical protein Mal4_16460 [Maioricimonas rarisocia]|uniref:Uncharacterized protein n=1 Tax=Maioricimonas rarisocia TaxID=2528026 RepID=A0A517Z4D4_9PLAN|nr:hypothetical protein [Maioricimonas rarisocia]QDU37336.1 hypothetical protein Mal4_16460 [Maioricimonas rarisocia]